MPNPSGGVSPDLDVVMLRAMNIGGCDEPNHGFALDCAPCCRACFAILVAAIRTETLAVVESHLKRNTLIYDSPSFVGEWVAIPKEAFEAVRALTGSQTPNGE